MKHTDEQFIFACEKGNLNDVKILLRDIDCKSDKGETALTIASFNGHTEIVEFLLNHGANLEITNCMGGTALNVSKRFEITQMLLKKGASIDVKNCIGGTALINAAFNQRFDIAKLLIESGANVDSQEDDGYTALIYAADGQKDLVEILLDNNASLDIKNRNGTTALAFASYRGRTDIVSLLLEKGADPSILNEYNQNAYSVAALNGHIPIMYLLKNEIIHQVDKYGNTLLIIECEKVNEENVFFLIDKGADIYATNEDGYSALDMLVENDDLSEKLQALKEKLILDQSIDSITSYNVSL